MDKIHIMSRRIRRLFQFCLMVTPLFPVYFWLIANTPYDFLARLGLLHIHFTMAPYTQPPLTLHTRLLAMLVDLLICGIYLYGFSLLIRLFRHYEQGMIFCMDNVRCYQKLAGTLLAWMIGSTVGHGLITLIMSYNHPALHHLIRFSFKDTNIATLVIAVMILIISQVMKEGYRLDDENRHTI